MKNMKILFVSIGLFLSLTVHAQEKSLYYFQEVGTLEIGPRIGFTTSAIISTGDPNIARGVKLGIVAGIFGRKQLTDQWAINTDFSYSTRGNKNDVINLENSYIDLSVVVVRNVKYRMFNNDMTFDFFLGPGLSFNLNSEFKESNIPVNPFISPQEFNVVIGGALPFGPILLTATNRLGLTNLLGNPSQGSKWTSFTTEWTIAYRFKQKKALK